MSKQQIKHIEELKLQLRSLGYHPFQIDNMIRDIVKTSQIEKLTAEELNRLDKELETHIEFARKCFNH